MTNLELLECLLYEGNDFEFSGVLTHPDKRLRRTQEKIIRETYLQFDSRLHKPLYSWLHIAFDVKYTNVERTCLIFTTRSFVTKIIIYDHAQKAHRATKMNIHKRRFKIMNLNEATLRKF